MTKTNELQKPVLLRTNINTIIPQIEIIDLRVAIPFSYSTLPYTQFEYSEMPSNQPLSH